ncbi:MAG: hypothetical protein GXY89_08890 [Tissierellia bacterium]|nr:hypothetical protein [Tissierellia bacterium]
MWMAFGISAIITAILNVVFAMNGKTNKWFGFLSLSLTLLTVCAFYSDAASRVISEDWSGLMDILPSTAKALWVCSVASILINGFALVIKSSK